MNNGEKKKEAMNMISGIERSGNMQIDRISLNTTSCDTPETELEPRRTDTVINPNSASHTGAPA